MTNVQALGAGAGAGLLLLLLFLVAGDDKLTANAPYVPKEYILLNCGSTGLETDKLNRNWTGDIGSLYAPSLHATRALALQHDSSVPPIPYLTARVFTSSYTYYFPLTAGRKYLRLHFYPANYSYDHAACDAIFSVTSGSTTFLTNFSASATAQASKLQYIIKEFSVNSTLEGLNVTFTPSGYANVYAFVNGIEIIPMPDLFGRRIPWLANDWNSSRKIIDPDWALETIHRLNVGGKSVSPVEDSGLYRSWNTDSFSVSDDSYYYNADDNVTIAYTNADPSYMAPKVVYSSARSMLPFNQLNLMANLTWHLSIDSGFEYLVRLHFCEIQYVITKPNQRNFDIFINNQIAEKGFDVIRLSGGLGIPIYKDFFVSIPGSGKMDLPIALHPNHISLAQYGMEQYDNVILNGLEVFKLQNKYGSLAGLNPLIRPLPPVDTRESKTNLMIRVGVIGGILVLLLTGLFFLWIYRHQKRKGKDNASAPSSLQLRRFTSTEISSMSENFAYSVGHGGYGDVYRGKLDDGTEVAIKRGRLWLGEAKTKRGVCHFKSEIEVLYGIQHENLVSLIGFYDEIDNMILVYKYMAHGTLREHLYKTTDEKFQPKLNWRQRLNICIGAARGLSYLHENNIIHYDVKTANILLDKEWVAKISDFGLAKRLHTNGSCGHIDPLCPQIHNQTKKSDVYSFGVVLLEVLCARKAFDGALAYEQKQLADWAKICREKRAITEIVDSFLKGLIAPQCFEIFVETALKCVANRGTERPKMKDVLKNLEFALEMQERAEAHWFRFMKQSLCGLPPF